MELIKEVQFRINKKGNKIRYAIFKCPFCFKEVEKRLWHGLRDKSCGCHWIKHGGEGTKLYKVWAGMKQRILNPNSKFYGNYGGRGITICPEWANDYIAFRDWALNNEYKEGLFIDRVNPDENYEPSNCRFLTKTESSRNKTNTITLEIANEIRELYATGNYTQVELAIKYNKSKQTVNYIIHNKQWI